MSQRARSARPALVAVTALALAAALSAGAPAPGDASTAAPGGTAVAARTSLPPVSRLVATAVPVRDGFRAPTDVTSAPGERSRLYVVEQGGRIMAVAGSRKWTYLRLGSRVRSGGEQGLLGLAFSPRFAKDRRLFITYTRRDGALVLARLTAARPTARTVKASTLRVLLVVPHPTYSNHNGGSMAFGPDGLLYLGTGDGGGAGNPSGSASRLQSLSGKILRLDVSRRCGSHRYCIPKANPYRGRSVRAEILHRGLRNPWKISFDPAGRLWVADVGQNRYEEVDVLARGARGLDLGWSCREGRHRYDRARCRPGARYTAPTIELGHPSLTTPDRAAESITGGYVYRGSRYAAIAAGAYVFGDWVTGNLWAYRGGVLARVGSLPRVTSFGEDGTGELFAVTSAGSLVRLDFRLAGVSGIPVR